MSSSTAPARTQASRRGSTGFTTRHNRYAFARKVAAVATRAVRCQAGPAKLASSVFARDSATEVQMHDDGNGLHLRTRDANRFFHLMNSLVLEDGLEIEALGPADDDVQSVYMYLVGDEGVST